MSQTQAASNEPDLRQYISVLVRRKWIIITIVVVAVASSIVYSVLQATVYEARAEVLIKGGAGEEVLDPKSPLTPVEQLTDSELRLMNGGAMRASITKQLGYFPDFTAEAGEKTPRISVFVRDGDPEVAAKQATDFVNAFVRSRRATTTRELRQAIKDVQAQQPGLDKEAAATLSRIQTIDFLLAAGAPEDERAQLRFEKARLTESITTGAIARRQAALQETLDELTKQLDQNLSRGNYTVAAAVIPESPVQPKPFLNAAIAFLTGLLVGIAAAFAVDFFDDTMRTKEELDRVTGAIPVLGLIPTVPSWRDRGQTLLESLTHPHSATAEAYRTLRANLEFAAIDHKVGIIHITSSTSGEGKTTTAANLAVVLAAAGKRVVLIDCDLRRPRLHKFFNMDGSVGFTSVLKGEVDAQDVVQPVAGVEGLLVLPSGPIPPNPAELLSTKAARNLLDSLATFADHVVVDSPPLLPVADSSILAGYVDATVMVVTARSTTRRSLRRSLEILAQLNAPLEGILFNGIDREAGYGYGYGYGYSDDEEPRPKANA